MSQRTPSPAPQKAAPPGCDERVQRGHWSDATLGGSLSHDRTVGRHQSCQPPLPALERSEEEQGGEVPFYLTRNATERNLNKEEIIAPVEHRIKQLRDTSS